LNKVEKVVFTFFSSLKLSSFFSPILPVLNSTGTVKYIRYTKILELNRVHKIMLRSHSFLLCLLSCFITHLPAISGAVAAAEPDVSLNVKKGICDISYSNNKFDKQIEIWEKENDWHA
jgi:hypothetical protein